MAEITPGMGVPHLDLGEDDPGEGIAEITLGWGFHTCRLPEGADPSGQAPSNPTEKQGKLSRGCCAGPGSQEGTAVFGCLAMPPERCQQLSVPGICIFLSFLALGWCHTWPSFSPRPR